LNKKNSGRHEKIDPLYLEQVMKKEIINLDEVRVWHVSVYDPGPIGSPRVKQLRPGDIKKALQWFAGKYGRRVRSIGLHTSNSHMADEIPLALRVFWSKSWLGVSRNGVYMSAGENIKAYPESFWGTERAVSYKDTDYHCNTNSNTPVGLVINTDSKHRGRGMPRVELPWEKIKELQDQGKDTLTIIRELKLPQASTYRAIMRKERRIG
jgi:hypothetical protein